MSIEPTNGLAPEAKDLAERIDDAIERLIVASKANAEASSAAKGDPSTANLNAWSKTLAEVQAASLGVARLQTRKAA